MTSESPCIQLPGCSVPGLAGSPPTMEERLRTMDDLFGPAKAKGGDTGLAGARSRVDDVELLETME